jgi:hypothetical protein
MSRNDLHARQRRFLANLVGLLVVGTVLVTVYGGIILAFFGVDVLGYGS